MLRLGADQSIGRSVVICDLTIDALRAGLNGLDLTPPASEDAVANMETPGYVAGQVDFEDQLAERDRLG